MNTVQFIQIVDTRLSVACCLSYTSLQEAADLLPPFRHYTLCVSSKKYFAAKRLLQEISADVIDNPFSPYVNLEVDHRLTEEAWYLRDPYSKKVGSEGV